MKGIIHDTHAEYLAALNNLQVKNKIKTSNR